MIKLPDTHIPIDPGFVSTEPNCDHVSDIPVDFDEILLSSLCFDQRYQREITPKGRRRISIMAKEFDWAEFGVLLVSPIGNNYFAVIDGQHRAHAAALCGFKTVPCMSVPMSFEQQARIFSGVNTKAVRVSALNVYKSSLAAKEAWALNSMNAVKEAGCHLAVTNASASEKKGGVLYCVGAIRKFIDDGHRKKVVLALSALRESPEGDRREFYTAEVVRPWIQLAITYPEAKKEDLSEFLREHPLELILHKVSLQRDKPEFYRRSTRSLLEMSMKVLFRHFMKSKNKEEGTT